MAKQNRLLDDTTIHFIAHHSCWVWFNLRMYWTSTLFCLLTTVICVMNKGVVNNVTLVIAFRYS